MRSGRQGQVLVVFAVGILFLVGIAALAIDVGYLYSVKGELQRCTDAGALAGAYVFHDGDWNEDTFPAWLRTKAVLRAYQVASRDPVGDTNLANTEVKVVFDKEINQIRVITEREVKFFFAGIFGKPTLKLTASATAEAKSVDRDVICLAPFAIPYPGNKPFKQGEKWDGQKMAQPFDASGNIDEIQVRLEAIAGKIFALNFFGAANSVEFQNKIENPCGDNVPFTLQATPATLAQEAVIPLNLGNIFNNLVLISDVNWLDKWEWNKPGADTWMYAPRLMRVLVYDQIYTAVNGTMGGALKIVGFAGFWIEKADKPGTWVMKLNYRVTSANAVGRVSNPVILPQWPPNLKIPSLKTTRLVE